jgi:hypothetical protein
VREGEQSLFSANFIFFAANALQARLKREASRLSRHLIIISSAALAHHLFTQDKTRQNFWNPTDRAIVVFD